MLNDLLPLVSFLFTASQTLTFLFDLVQFSGQFLTSDFKLLQVDNFSLVGIGQALILAFQALLASKQLFLLGT